MRIGGVDLEREVLVVAEIGNNHEGDMGRARELVLAAAASGAQAVKFQTIVPERLVARSQAARLAQLRRFCLSYDQFASLAETAAQAKVLFMSTPFDVESVRHLTPLVPAFKIASSDNNFDPLLEAVAKTGKPALISTGMADIAGIQRTCRVFEKASGGKSQIVLLHCVSAYPTPAESANLLAIPAIARATGHAVGYSDHTLGIEQAVLSVALGACVIEKHFTLSKTQSEFRDHQLSADPAELAELVRRVRAARTALGDGVKRVMPAEEGVLAAARRSAMARRDLPAGHTVTMDDLDWLRPGGGVGPDAAHLLLGKRLRAAVAAGDGITADMVG
jgi:N,N'-diacetyllegionaminate synthase